MKLRFKQNIISVIMIFALGLFFNSCNNKEASTIRIGALEGPSAISFIKLIDKPITIDGKRVEVIIKSDPQQIQALMMRNELDFAVLPTVMAANLYNKGIKYRVLACPIWGTLYILTSNNKCNH